MKENKNVTITYNFGASGTLQKQIEQGASADIFMSDAAKQMDELKDKNLMVSDTIKNLLKNDIVLVVPKDSTKVKGFEYLASDSIQKWPWENLKVCLQVSIQSKYLKIWTY